MGNAIISLYIVILLLCYFKKQSIYPISMFASIFSPVINIGNRRIDGAYAYIIVLFILVILYKKIKIPPRFLKRFFILNIYLISLYVFSWAVYGFHEPNKVIAIFVGSVKILFIMYACWMIDYDHKISNIDRIVRRFILVSVIVNFIAVLFEMVSFNHSVNILKDIFLNEIELSYLSGQIRGGRWTRYYGIFKFPMNMGVFAVFTTILSLSYIKGSKKNKSIVFFALNIIIGIASGSKAYMLGIVVLLIAYYYLPLLRNKIESSSVVPFIVVPITAIIIFASFDKILDVATYLFGSGVAYRLSFITNWTGALTTRYDSSQGVLREMPRFILNHLFIGVGPGSIQNEPNMDNSYFVILHNGGLFALIPVMWFYFSLLKQFKSDNTLLVLVLGIFLMGIAFPSFVFTEITTWIIYYFTLKADSKESITERKYFHQKKSKVK